MTDATDTADRDTDQSLPEAHEPGVTAHGHPSDLQYIVVALILAVVTGIEVAVYYVTSLKDALVPILLVLSLIKFVMVVLWFMHLRFDSRIFRRLFVTGLILAIAVYLIVLTTFDVWSR